ncbi:hypothetical protein [Pseudoalteromonas sp. S16_S37]|uniref:hypothetical protein n=1 Tax=Pseudoalteromonas sp. S16_S37 TaxID=2720228 RepID=UPI00168150EE|nr:hypothetical protein [Pseudoalteromonas sp. S16_S37]MBD1582503.1 hypothetical protein [Pseudoalteromonas sp. S16_S37]
MEQELLEFESTLMQEELAEQQRLETLCRFRIDLRKQGYSHIVPQFADMDEVREVREDVFKKVDVLVNIAEDAQKGAAPLRAYRQSLRDITEQSFDFSKPFNPFAPIPTLD